MVPSGIRPLPWVARTAWHRLVLPDRQNLHLRHSAVYSGITWSPGLTLVTPSPTSTTMPPPSWPSTAGKMPSGSSPLSVKASVWQTPVWVIFTSTSPACGGATSISTICSGWPGGEGDGGTGFHVALLDPGWLSRMVASGALGRRRWGLPGPAVAWSGTVVEANSSTAEARELQRCKKRRIAGEKMSSVGEKSHIVDAGELQRCEKKAQRWCTGASTFKKKGTSLGR